MLHKTTLDTWSETCHNLYDGQQSSIHPIHSCVIKGERHFIHSPSLASEDPGYFEQLQAYSDRNNAKLAPDRRIEEVCRRDCRRLKLLPILFLAFGVQAAAQSQTTLKMIGGNLHPHDHKHSAFEKLTDIRLPVDLELSKALQTILVSHLKPQDDDPTTIADDIQNLADYYAQHPEAVALIESIADEDWSLIYAPHTFQTDISGSRMSIDSVSVYFDPRSGAELKFYDRCAEKKPFCVASPADALLHELLHVQTIRKETSHFIRQGGMNPHVYPAEHERQTILKENILYKTMSLRDKRPRPIRSEHTGRHVLVSCVTCVN